MTKTTAMAIKSKNLLLQNQNAYDFETWHEASGGESRQKLYKSWPWYLMARSTWGAYAFELGKLSKCHLKGKTLWKWANGLNIYDSENKCTPGAGLPQTRRQYT